MLAEFYTEFSAIFNTREQAYLFWGLIALAWLFSSKNFRGSIGNILPVLFNRKFIYIYIIALSYIFLSIFLLRFANIWDVSLIKDTVMWVLFVAFPMMYQAAKMNSFQKFLKEMVKPLVAFSVIFEYIFGLYTFQRWIEFLMVPFLVILGGTLALRARKAGHHQVHKFANGIVSLMGLIAVFSVVVHLFRHYEDYQNFQVLMQFLLPLCMSLLLLPLLYGLAMFVHYEEAFKALKIHFRNKSAYRYAMLVTMLRFNGDLEGMIRWKQLVQSKNFQEKSEISEAISQIKILQRSERNPHTVVQGLGWSPYQVKDLLISKGMQTPVYKNTIDDEFSCISHPIRLNDNSAMSDSISYMVLGKQLIATELHLALKVYYGSENHSLSLLEFLNCAEILYEGIFGSMLPKDVKSAILGENNYSVTVRDARLFVKKDLWHNKTMGFGLNLKVTHDRHRQSYGT